VNDFEESTPVARYWVERVQEEGITSIECNHRRIVGLSGQDFQDIIDLASTWLEYVQQKLKEEKNRLLPMKNSSGGIVSKRSWIYARARHLTHRNEDQADAVVPPPDPR
jgi:hypothetical protein